MTTKCRTVRTKKDGWSYWQYPQMKGYLMQCCDCGLVHEVEFKVMRVLERNQDGTRIVEDVEGYDVGLRMKRKTPTSKEGIEVT